MLPLALPYFLETTGGMECIGLAFYAWMIYQCYTRERPSPEKFFWLLFIIFTPPVGALIYFLFRVVRIRG